LIRSGASGYDLSVAGERSKLFFAIVVAGTSFGAASCYRSHELEEPSADSGRDAVADVGVLDAARDVGGPDVGCPPERDCEACAPLCFTSGCACEAFCCFI